jgi:plastocyanin
MSFKTNLLLISLCALPLDSRASNTNVSYGSFFFSPRVVKINVGDSVQWSGAGSHTLLGTGSDAICGGNFLPCMHTFNTAGTFNYQCTLPGHAASGMTGTVVVVTANIPPAPAVLTNATMLPNGQFRFTVLSTANRTNIIQTSTNLSDPNQWQAISTIVPATQTFQFTDTNAGGLQLRFYRVNQPE